MIKQNVKESLENISKALHECVMKVNKEAFNLKDENEALSDFACYIVLNIIRIAESYSSPEALNFVGEMHTRIGLTIAKQTETFH